MALFLGGRRVEDQGLRIDREAESSLLQRVLGGVDVAALEQGTAVERELVAAGLEATRSSAARALLRKARSSRGRSCHTLPSAR